MFGHDDKNDQQNQDHTDEITPTESSAPTLPSDDQAGSSDSNKPDDTNVVNPGPSASIGSDPAASDLPWKDPAANDGQARPDVLSPAGGYPKPTSHQLHSLPSASDDNKPTDSNDLLDSVAGSDLASIKIQALDELYPMIDKLDLPAEDKFRTIMMMIQASDNQELVKAAYEAAHQIDDEKVRAQALLDIVNEINYFTQQPGN